jgi:hypothetical protein
MEPLLAVAVASLCNLAIQPQSTTQMERHISVVVVVVAIHSGMPEGVVAAGQVAVLAVVPLKAIRPAGRVAELEPLE